MNRSASYSRRGIAIQKVEQKQRGSIFGFLEDAFLPTDWDNGAVTDDYLPYQFYDSIQAFCSSISGLLASRAILLGVGVGDAYATATNALLIQVMQETSGRVATILFAWRMAPYLDSDAKTWRFAADLFNDAALLLDLATVHLPKTWFVPIACFATVMRALTGVAGGSSRSGITAHFALMDNIGDVSAKDSAQETVVSLFGMLCGTVIVTHVTTTTSSIWIAFTLLTVLHLWTNYKAVSHVVIPNLNDQRIAILFHDDSIKTPLQVSSKENILLWRPQKRINMGASIPDNYKDIDHYIAVFQGKPYILLPHFRNDALQKVDILLHADSSAVDQIEAYDQALELLSDPHCLPQPDEPHNADTLFTSSLRWRKKAQSLRTQGWNLEKSNLSTGPHRYIWKRKSL